MCQATARQKSTNRLGLLCWHFVRCSARLTAAHVQNACSYDRTDGLEKQTNEECNEPKLLTEKSMSFPCRYVNGNNPLCCFVDLEVSLRKSNGLIGM